MSAPLHLVRLVLDRRAVLRVGARHRLGQLADEGALLHAGLSQLFASSSGRAIVPLHTFAVDDLRAASVRLPELLFLLAYAGMHDAALTAAMGPAREALVRRCETREVPVFEAGQRLGFRLRACPIARTRKAGRAEEEAGSSRAERAREIDAFLHATLSVPRDTTIDRETVYANWLRAQLARGGACTLEQATLVEFRLETMRRGGARLERPNALLEGTLRVDDPAGFRELLIRGVGRHRAFGFGMLLLRPAGRSC